MLKRLLEAVKRTVKWWPVVGVPVTLRLLLAHDLRAQWAGGLIVVGGLLIGSFLMIHRSPSSYRRKKRKKS